MKKLILAAAAVVFALAAAPFVTTDAEAEDNRYGKQKVVYHINYEGGDGDRAYRAAMRNIQNHINAVGADNLDLRVVLHGNGVAMMKSAKGDERLQTQVASLKGQDVAFHICNNTLVGREISYEDDLYDVWDDDIVPSGVAELAHLQQQGYAYIKP